ncbi:MAG: aminomethyltransferase family protein [Paracoccaceae bacterium]
MKDDLSHFRAPLRKTPFHPRQQSLNWLNRWGAWAGCTTPLCYGDEAMEHTAIRNAASLYDLCPMVKYRIKGPEAAEYLTRLTVRNAAKLTPGGVQYTVWCDDDGKVLDDGTIFRLSETEFRLCCQERHLPWLLDSAAGFDVTVADVTDDIAALSLQGPTSASVLSAAGFDIRDLKPFRSRSFPFDSDTVLISRTGFTGDLGYELWTKPWAALPLWDTLMGAGAPFGIRPVGSDALNVARLEAGFLTTNLDFIPAHQALREDRARSPLELGLGWLTDWDKGPFTGRAALLAERDGRTSKWALIGLDIGGNVEAGGSLLYHRKEREAGFITAACWSPATKRNIALAQVEARHAEARDLWVEIYALRELQYVKLMVPVRLAERPFFTHPRRRATPPGRF